MRLRTTLACFALLGTSVLPLPAQAAAGGQSRDPEGLPHKASTVARHGITWHFAEPMVVGTFANGDPWVIGPVRITGIDPRSVEVDGRVKHGSMVDPDPSSMLQGYDSRLFGDEKRERFRAELDVATGLSPARPLVLGAGHSLVSVQSRDDAKLLPQLQTAAVLTVLAEAPAPDAFRPPYGKGDKRVRHRAAELDLRVLQRCKPTPDVPPIETIASQFERVWLDHFPTWPVRYAHPADNMPDYGREIAAAVGSAGLLLNLDLPDAQKRTLLVRFVQLGIDLHGLVRGGCRWPGLGGHGSGRKFPILFAGLVLHDEQMLAVGRDFDSERRAKEAGQQYFGEDAQTFLVRETSPGVYNWGFGGYTKDHAGLPEWGFAHAERLEGDDARWDGNDYRRCCTANGWVGQTLAARLMGLQEAWAHPAYFAYMDRYMQVQHTDAWHRAWLPWHASMWDALRAKT